MALELSAGDQAMLAGAHGPAAALAMRIVARMAALQGAGALLDITHAHIDSTIYIGDATLDFAEHLASLGARVAVPTSLNVSGLDEHGWRGWPVPPGWAHKAHRQMLAYQSMGTEPTWTCAPYQTHARPRFGQQIAWGESNAIAFANSVIGARTERYPDLLDICCAIAGRAPAAGLHLSANRAGEILLTLEEVPREVQEDEAFYPVLGALVGELAGDSIPVVDGLTAVPSEDALKAVAASAASTGRVALFHLVGITPEAPTVAAAFQGRRPTRTVTVGMRMLRAVRRRLSSADGEALDLVVLGSPHFSLNEFRALAGLVAGKRRHPGVRVLVTTSRIMRDLADAAGVIAPLRAFGAELTVDTCILATPMVPAGVRRLMTNSGKYAYYAPGLLGTTVAFGTLRDCVASAVAGRVIVDAASWGGDNTDEREDTDNHGDTESTDPTEADGAWNCLSSASVQGTPLVDGGARGVALVSREPLSFWGGYDAETGTVIDRRHPLCGERACGRVLVLPFSRGSSTTTAVLLESIRAGTAPAAIVTSGPDPFFALASIVAEELYGRTVPVVAVAPADLRRFSTGDAVSIEADGRIVPGA